MEGQLEGQVKHHLLKLGHLAKAEVPLGAARSQDQGGGQVLHLGDRWRRGHTGEGKVRTGRGRDSQVEARILR